MAYIYFHCASCAGKLKTEDNTILGKRIRCPRCGSPCPVPMPEHERVAPLVAEQPAASVLEEAPAEAFSKSEPVAESDMDELLADMMDDQPPALPAVDDLAETDLIDEMLTDAAAAEKSAGNELEETDLLQDLADEEEIESLDEAALLDVPPEDDEEDIPAPKKGGKKKRRKKGGITLVGLFSGFLVLSYLGALGAVFAGLVDDQVQPPRRKVQPPPFIPPDDQNKNGGIGDPKGKMPDDGKNGQPIPPPGPDGKKGTGGIVPPDGKNGNKNKAGGEPLPPPNNPPQVRSRANRRDQLAFLAMHGIHHLPRRL